MNERVRCGIYAKMDGTLADNLGGFTVVSAVNELSDDQRILDKIILGWNARDRKQPSPHSLCPDWVSPEIDEYRHKPIVKEKDEAVGNKRFGAYRTPAVGEEWPVRNKPGEHAVIAG